MIRLRRLFSSIRSFIRLTSLALHTTIFSLPIVKGSFTDAVFPTQILYG
jgi:hypothetical protein